ncbi:MAG: DUF2189 domain-containing protein [Pseudomonadota bacterium]
MNALAAAHPHDDVASTITTVFQAGWQDFLARPTVAVFLILVYPLVGLLLYRFAFDQELLPLLFPIASGFALIGPLSAVGLFGISRNREQNREPEALQAFGELTGDALVPTIKVGLLLLVIYAAWIGVAQLIYDLVMGGYVPGSLGDLAATVLGSGAGWVLIVVGCGVGALFALFALAVGAISLPAIFDRRIDAGEAVGLSVSTVLGHPRLFLAWGIVVAVGLAIASLPAFLGLLVALPVFGHATWHLYRKTVPPAPAAPITPRA